MLADPLNRILYIYSLSEINAVFEAKEFLEQLIYKIENFNFNDDIIYFLDAEYLYYAEKEVGKLVEINIETGKQKVYDFGLKIKDLLVIEGRSVYYKCRDELVYFVDLDWVFLRDEKKA